MADDVLINKAASIERCVARAREEYASDPASFAADLAYRKARAMCLRYWRKLAGST